MKKVEELKVKIFADGADKAGMLEMYEKPFVKGLTTNPTLMKTSIKLAFSEATIKSDANAKEQPAPAATPFNRQIIGFGILRISRMIGL